MTAHNILVTVIVIFLNIVHVVIYIRSSLKNYLFALADPLFFFAVGSKVGIFKKNKFH